MADADTNNADATENQEEHADQKQSGIHRGKSIPADQWGEGEIVIEEPDVLAPKSAMREEIEAASKAAAGGDQDDGEDTSKDDDEAAPVTETPDEPEQIVEDEPVGIEDPGEYQPADYSFDVVTYDDEGKKPKTVHITSVDQWDELLEADPNFGSTSSLMKAMRASNRMERGLEEDQKDWEARKAQYDEAVSLQEEYQGNVQSVANEMNYLATKGELPVLTQGEQNMSWYKSGTLTPDPKVLQDHPNVKAWVDLVLYMRRESANRTKAGLPPLKSAIDAFNAMQLDSRVKQDQQRAGRAAQVRKENGARVSSPGTTPVSAIAPAGIKVGRNLGSLQRLGQNWSN